MFLIVLNVSALPIVLLHLLLQQETREDSLEFPERINSRPF